MTQLISQQAVEALRDLEELRQEMAHIQSLSGPSLARFDNLRRFLVHLLQCLTGSAHEVN
jgi:hypothetical protein